MRVRGFTLVETLVVIAVMALLIGVLVPTLGAARETGRSAVCMSNLRQAGVLCRVYADEQRGYSPAIGVPYGATPNWALVVLEGAGRAGAGAELYGEATVLVCPSTRAASGVAMTRSYAINATGHARDTTDPLRSADPDHYDLEQAHIRLDLADSARSGPLLIDSRVAPPVAGSPPATRTASMIDFRQPAHVDERLGRVHLRRRSNFVSLDGSAHSGDVNPESLLASWKLPLP